MELRRVLTWLAYAIFSTVFLRECIVSIIKWQEGKVAISVEEVKSKYIKFPSISVCLDMDTDNNKEELGFTEMRPLNESFSFLKYSRHSVNGFWVLL